METLSFRESNDTRYSQYCCIKFSVKALNTNTVANNNLGACSFDVSTEISSNKRIGGIENGRDL